MVYLPIKSQVLSLLLSDFTATSIFFFFCLCSFSINLITPSVVIDGRGHGWEEYWLSRVNTGPTVLHTNFYEGLEGTFIPTDILSQHRSFYILLWSTPKTRKFFFVWPTEDKNVKEVRNGKQDGPYTHGMILHVVGRTPVLPYSHYGLCDYHSISTIYSGSDWVRSKEQRTFFIWRKITSLTNLKDNVR